MVPKSMLGIGVAICAAAAVVGAGPAVLAAPASRVEWNDGGLPRTSDYRLTGLSAITLGGMADAWFEGQKYDLDLGERKDGTYSGGEKYYYFNDPAFGEFWGPYESADHEPLISGPVGTAYYLVDNILPDDFDGDDYLFAQGIPAAVRVSLYQLTKAEPGSNLAIEFVANPVGTAMALAAAGADAVLPDGGDLIVNPVGALRSNTVLLAGDVAKVVTGRDVADDLVENIGFHGLGAKGVDVQLKELLGGQVAGTPFAGAGTAAAVESDLSSDRTDLTSLRTALTKPLAGVQQQLSQARTTANARFTVAQKRINDRASDATANIDTGLKQAGAKLNHIATQGRNQLRASVPQLTSAARFSPKRNDPNRQAQQQDQNTNEKND